MRTVMLLLLVTLSGCGVQTRFEGDLNGGVSSAIDSYFLQWEGTAYRLGGADKRGLDCSAFVQNLYWDLYNKGLPRTTEAQAQQGYPIPPSELEPGDLVFFKTGWRNRHVGVYLGKGDFVHASTSVGVTRSSLSNDYWRDRFWTARRVE